MGRERSLKSSERVGYSEFSAAMPSANPATQPVEIEKMGDSAIRIKWADGHEGVYPNAYLRSKCRCANCVQEWTGEVLVRPETIPANIAPLRISPVGQYAIHIQWSDGHDSGIYSFDLLREVCPCGLCKAK